MTLKNNPYVSQKTNILFQIKIFYEDSNLWKRVHHTEDCSITKKSDEKVFKVMHYFNEKSMHLMKIYFL